VKARAVAVVVLLAGLAGCGPDGTVAEPPGYVSGTITITLGDRPFRLHVPASYGASAVPLVVLLHGYSATGAQQEAYLQLIAESDRRGFLYAIPDGTTNAKGERFWNATTGCCNFFGSTVDDSAYLSDLLRSVADGYHVDARRVYLVGHSNGGFMAYRMACDHAEQVTAVASFGGAMWTDAFRCRPTRPVSVLELHGTSDGTIRYDGEGDRYPSAATTVADWAGFDGCAGSPATSAPARDLLTDVPGAETTVTSYAAGCRGGSRAELWTMRGGSHVPALGPAFAPSVLDFLYAQVR